LVESLHQPKEEIMAERRLNGTRWLAAIALVCGGCALPPSQDFGGAPARDARAPAPSLADTEIQEAKLAFICEAAISRILLVKMSEVAARRAGSGGVRQFAHVSGDDDRRANRKLKELAWSKDLGVCSEMDDRRALLLLALQRYAGDEFDREYLTLQLDQRRRSVRLLREQAEKGADDELRSFAQSALPALETHLRTANLLADSR